MQAKTPWEMLTAEERSILTSKLVSVKNEKRLTKKEISKAGDKFNSLFKGLSDKEAEAGVTGFKNFIDVAGGHDNSNVWKQITQIEKFWLGKNNDVGIAFHVGNTNDFLKILPKKGFEVNAAYEKVNKHGAHINSARMITQYSSQPSFHLVQQSGYTTRWDSHFDKLSVAFTNERFQGSRSIEMAAAGTDHVIGTPMSASEVRQAIKTMGIVPPKEQ